MSRRTQLVARALTTLLLVAAPAASSAWVPQTVDFIAGEAVIARWPANAFPLEFQVTPGLTDDLGSGVARAALDRAMATWSSAADSAVSMAVVAERDVEANVFDGINAIQFSNDSSLQGSGFVALTFLNTAPDGTILEADVLVNDRAIGFTDDAGSPVGLDLETAMLRELGEVLGLAASPLGALESTGTVNPASAVMFPAARGVGESARSLTQDDVAAVASLYPSASSSRGSISGTVRRGAVGVFGAHVVAFDPLQQVSVGAVSLPDGSFELGGLPPGRYFLEVLPLRSPATPASLGGIFTSDLVETGFRRAFLNETLRLGAGGAITGVALEVQ